MAAAACLLPTGILQTGRSATTKSVSLSPCVGSFAIHGFKQLLQMGFVVFSCHKCQGSNTIFCCVHLPEHQPLRSPRLLMVSPLPATLTLVESCFTRRNPGGSTSRTGGEGEGNSYCTETNAGTLMSCRTVTGVIAVYRRCSM